MRRVVRAGLVLMLAPVAAMCLFSLAAVIGALWPGPVATVDRGGIPVRVGLAAGPIHHDILLPLSGDVRARLGFAAAAGVPVDDPQARWLVVGWGSRAFYTATGSYADLRAATVWRAVASDDAVLRLDVAGAVPPDAPGITWLDLSPAQAAALADTVLSDIASPTPLSVAGFSASDAFFPARGRFSLFNTCNVWIARSLRTAGQPFGGWTPTPLAVRLSLWRFAT